MKSHYLWITPGDPQGIGPEVTLKALLDPEITGLLKNAALRVRLVGGEDSLNEIEKVNRLPYERILAPKGGAFGAGWAIEKVVKEILKDPDSTHGLVTGPINKERFQEAGFPFQGHTDYLASLCGKIPVTMMLAHDQLRVTLVTDHLPLTRVSRSLTSKKIMDTITRTYEGLRHYFHLPSPRIAVLGLNPHAGENGRIGTEEVKKIQPAVRLAQKKGIQVEGPFPADGFFPTRRTSYDAVVAMYHDQGLIPLKLLNFEQGVNLTLGLPFLRTSVDHGTAFDIAGKNIASPASMIAAIKMNIHHLLGRSE
jgi:4-hydroxythreonine-4-phosphate dehydrogenase